MVLISFHAGIGAASVNFTEKLLAAEIGKPDAAATIYLCCSGGDSAGAASLHYFIRALPYPVHVHAMGVCASGGGAIMLAGSRRSCAPGTNFMLHGSRAADGSLSPHVQVPRAIYRDVLGWDEATINRFFSDPDEKWFSGEEAKQLGLITEIVDLQFPADQTLHIVPNGP